MTHNETMALLETFDNELNTANAHVVQTRPILIICDRERYVANRGPRMLGSRSRMRRMAARMLGR